MTTPGGDLRSHPFYRERLRRDGTPEPWELEDLEAYALESGDPFAGRLAEGAALPPFSLEIEACDDPPLWVGLAPRELEAWAGVLAALWERLGVSRGACVALYDYGSSPLVLLASATYTPYLRRGAAERLGVRVICNDGVALHAARLVEIFETLAPEALVIRRDVLGPVRQTLAIRGVEPARCCRWVLLSETDGVPSRSEVDALADAWGLPVRRTLRSDAAFLLAADCGHCGDFHVDPVRYRVEDLEAGGSLITARFAGRCPSVCHRLPRARRVRPACPLEPRAVRLRWT